MPHCKTPSAFHLYLPTPACYSTPIHPPAPLSRCDVTTFPPLLVIPPQPTYRPAHPL